MLLLQPWLLWPSVSASTIQMGGEFAEVQMFTFQNQKGTYSSYEYQNTARLSLSQTQALMSCR